MIFVFNVQVNEGCSYGILEAINYEIPIVYTDINPNNEILCVDEKVMMPGVNYINHKNVLNNLFCITEYIDILSKLGYVIYRDIHLFKLNCNTDENCYFYKFNKSDKPYDIADSCFLYDLICTTINYVIIVIII